MTKNIFFSDIEIIEQRIRELHYSDAFDENFDFDLLDNEQFSINIEYNLYVNQEEETEHLLIIILEIEEIEAEKDDSIHLGMVVQGHYKINSEIDPKEFSSLYHFGSLSLAINFLRTSFFNLTALTLNEGLSLPLIDMEALHKDYDERTKKESKKKNKK
ncbi:hypothetical protein [Winogradskyella sp. MIT101101]|uniref:hypothetical protein n=1 Tax=Winogradskyella sp. MIT101101 TaxID=3098297 RepID=UPI003999E995